MKLNIIIDPKWKAKIYGNESINDDESHMSACTTHMPTDSSGLTGPIRKLTGKTSHSLTLEILLKQCQKCTLKSWLYRVADTISILSMYILAANNSLQSVVHVHEKLKLCSKYELMGYFRPLY